MTLRETLAQLPADYEVVLKPKGGSVTYVDTAARWLEDDGRLHRLEDFELVSQLHLPDQQAGTLAALLAKDIEPIRFVVDGLVPEGLTILAGRPKLGKSWLALAMTLAVASGQPTLGLKTDQAESLYISLEDGERRLQDRVRILGGHHLPGDALGRFHYRCDWPPLDKTGMAQLEQWMTQHPDTRLIVIDTWGKVKPTTPGKDRYQEEYAVLGPLQMFATRHRVAIILVHHLRKQGADDWLEQLSGSQAVTGAADTLLGLFRERGQMDATLRLVSREVEERDLALKFGDGRWESMGDAAHYRTSVERIQVLEAIEALGGKASPKDIAALLSKSPANVSKLLKGLVEEKLVENASYGVYSLPLHPVEVVETVELLQPLQPNQPPKKIRSQETAVDSRSDDFDDFEPDFDDLPEPW